MALGRGEERKKGNHRLSSAREKLFDRTRVCVCVRECVCASSAFSQYPPLGAERASLTRSRERRFERIVIQVLKPKLLGKNIVAANNRCQTKKRAGALNVLLLPLPIRNKPKAASPFSQDNQPASCAWPKDTRTHARTHEKKTCALARSFAVAQDRQM